MNLLSELEKQIPVLGSILHPHRVDGMHVETEHHHDSAEQREGPHDPENSAWVHAEVKVAQTQAERSAAARVNLRRPLNAMRIAAAMAPQRVAAAKEQPAADNSNEEPQPSVPSEELGPSEVPPSTHADEPSEPVEA